MKKNTKYFLIAWVAFVLGVLIILPFANSKGDSANIALGGFMICLISFVYAISILKKVQIETRSSYYESSGFNKHFLFFIHTFSNLIPVLFGVLILFWANHQSQLGNNILINLSGNISDAYYTSDSNSIFFIHLENNTNRYGINKFRIPKEKQILIETKINIGSSAELAISKDDKDLENTRYISLYSLKVDDIELISIADYKNSTKSNSDFGYVFGAIFIITGLFYYKKNKLK